MWILNTLNAGFFSLRIIDLWVHPNNETKPMVVFVRITCTGLKNEFANSENVLCKWCFVNRYVGKSWKKVNFLIS